MMAVAVVAPVVFVDYSSSWMLRYENYHDDRTYLITGTRMTKRNGHYRYRHHHRQGGKKGKIRNFPSYCSPFERCCGNLDRRPRRPPPPPHLR